MKRKLSLRAVWSRRSRAAALVSPRASNVALPSVFAKLRPDEEHLQGAMMLTYHTTRNGASPNEMMCICPGRWCQQCIVSMYHIIVACSVSVCPSYNPGTCPWPGRLDLRAGSNWKRAEDQEDEKGAKGQTQRVRERTPARLVVARGSEDWCRNVLPLEFHTTRNGIK